MKMKAPINTPNEDERSQSGSSNGYPKLGRLMRRKVFPYLIRRPLHEYHH
jgi:hypothetical protein